MVFKSGRNSRPSEARITHRAGAPGLAGYHGTLSLYQIRQAHQHCTYQTLSRNPSLACSFFGSWGLRAHSIVDRRFSSSRAGAFINACYRVRAPFGGLRVFVDCGRKFFVIECCSQLNTTLFLRDKEAQQLGVAGMTVDRCCLRVVARPICAIREYVTASCRVAKNMIYHNGHMKNRAIMTLT